MNPILKKLQYKGQSPALLLDAPEEFAETAAAMEGQVDRAPAGAYSFALAFARSMAEAEAALGQVAPVLAENGVFWLAYPKGTSKKYRKVDINRDKGHARYQELGFEGVAMVAIDEDWSAMRFKRQV